MIPQVRFSSIIFLMLLQLAAPLIHAHINDKTNLGSSFHLPDFEQINALLEKGPVIIAPSFHEGEIITVSAGVKENQRRFLSNDNCYNFIAFSFVFPFSALQEIRRASVVQTDPIKRSRFFNLASPRAPPFFTV
jgi:hypothetical protein